MSEGHVLVDSVEIPRLEKHENCILYIDIPNQSPDYHSLTVLSATVYRHVLIRDKFEPFTPSQSIFLCR